MSCKQQYKLLIVCSLVFVACKSTTALDFERKQQCQKYVDEIESRLHRDNKSNVNMYAEMTRVFYSPKQNSCVYEWKVNIFSTDSNIIQNLYLSDALSQEIILSKTINFKDSQSAQLINDFFTQVQEYK